MKKRDLRSKRIREFQRRVSEPARSDHAHFLAFAYFQFCSGE